MNEKTFLDSNIFIYAADKKSLFYDESLEIIKDSVETGFFTSDICFLEFYQVITDSRKIPVPCSPEEALLYIQKLWNTPEIDFLEADILGTFEEKEHQNNLVKYNITRFDIYDYLIAACLKKNQIRKIITFNSKDFKKYPWLTVVDPRKRYVSRSSALAAMPSAPCPLPSVPSAKPQAPSPKLSVLFRCDGSPEIGLGHIVRCLALADELRDLHNCRITFAMRKGLLGIQMVEEKGYQVITPRDTDQTFNYGKWLNECVRKVDARAIVFDVRDGLTRAVVKELRDKGIMIVTIDDPEDKRLEADLAFYPPVPQVKQIDWTGFTGKLYVGWEWVILRKEFSSTATKSQKPKTQNPKPKILVTMGGSDPQGITLKAVKALEMLDEDFEAVVILGAGFQHKKQLNNLLFGCKHHFDMQEDVKDMAEIMSQSDLAVASFGVTAYELAAMGVPAIYLCLTEDHAKSASAFVEEGMAISLGVVTQMTDSMLAKAVNYQLNDMPERLRMSERAEQQVDGQGAIRVAIMVAKRDKNIVGGKH